MSLLSLLDINLSRRLVLLLLLVYSSHQLRAQQAAIETEIFDCVRAAYQSGGYSLDSLMLSFEANLVGEGLISDRSGAEYRSLLQQIASGQRILRPMERLFSSQVARIIPDSAAYKECLYLQVRFLRRAPESTFSRFAAQTMTIRDSSMTAREESRILLNVLDEAALEQPLYRLLTYYLIDLAATEESFETPSLDSIRDEGNNRLDPLGTGQNSLRLYYTQENQILIDNVRMDPEYVNRRIERHLRSYGADAVFVVDIDPDLSFRDYMAVKDQILLVIDSVRNQYAQERFGKTLASLTEAEKAMVDRRYPIQVIFPRG
jgi:hypothetical protein